MEQHVAPKADSSPSLRQRTHWWYRVRSDLLACVFGDRVADARLLLDVGSADAPSVGWLPDTVHVVSVDIDLAALGPGGVCADAGQLPFADGSFDHVTAFDVVEHFADEDRVLSELHRVLRPDGRACLSVPAYRWAWTGFDVAQGHHRRYTRPRLRAALRRNGFEPVRTTHAFATMFPAFALRRGLDRLVRRPPSSELAGDGAAVSRVMTLLGRLDRAMLARWDLPVGSSIFVEARRT